MTSLFDDRFKALGEPWAREADFRLAIRARAQRRITEWAVGASDHEVADNRDKVRRLLKASFAPEGEVAFLRALADETGASPEDLARRLEDYARQAADEAESELPED